MRLDLRPTEAYILHICLQGWGYRTILGKITKTWNLSLYIYNMKITLVLLRCEIQNQ